MARAVCVTCHYKLASSEARTPSGGWWPRPESNQRHTDFQSAALPTELLGRAGASGNRSARKGARIIRAISPARQEVYSTTRVAGRLKIAAPAIQIHIEATLSGLASTRRS